MSPRKQAHQPNIAGSMQSIVAAAKLHKLELAGALDAVVALLDTRRSGEVPSETVESVAGVALTSFAGELVTVTPKASNRQTSDVVADLIKLGIDGENFAFGVIRYEAQYHTRLVWLEANRVAQYQSGRSPEDLAGWGWLGLRQAMRQFDPSMGYKFSTYAMTRIQGAIRDGIRSENPVPKRLLTMHRKFLSATEELSEELGRAPTVEEISLAIGHPASQISELMPRLRPAASVDEILADADEVGSQIGVELQSGDDPYEEAEKASRRAAIESALDDIEEKYSVVIRMVLCQGLSVAETRRATGVSDREIRRRLDRGCKLLAPVLAEWAHTI